jgi:hypothetical protein
VKGLSSTERRAPPLRERRANRAGTPSCVRCTRARCRSRSGIRERSRAARRHASCCRGGHVTSLTSPLALGPGAPRSACVRAGRRGCSDQPRQDLQTAAPQPTDQAASAPVLSASRRRLLLERRAPRAQVGRGLAAAHVARGGQDGVHGQVPQGRAGLRPGLREPEVVQHVRLGLRGQAGLGARSGEEAHEAHVHVDGERADVRREAVQPAAPVPRAGQLSGEAYRS